MSTFVLACLLLTACLFSLVQAASHVESTYSSAVPSIPAVESKALVHIIAGLSDKGSNVLLMRGWDKGNTHNICKSWQGLTCGRVGSDFHIVGINLTGWGLEGSLAPQIGNLIVLSVLDLSKNLIRGLIPPSLGNCTSLVYLNLHSNHFTGAIPDEFGILSQLQTLQLSENNLTGFIPQSLGNCTKLLSIDLTSNQLTGPIPAEFGMLHFLKRLVLQANRLTGDLPSSLRNCTNLFQLDLSVNMLTGAIPVELSSLSNLTMLFLHQNNLTGAIPRSMGNFTYLTELTLDANRLTGLIPNELGLLTKLRHLFLRINNLTGPVPASLGNCTSLAYLELHTNELTGPIPAELGLLSKVLCLGLWDNNLRGTIPSSLGNCTSLIYLELSFNRLTGLIPMAITTMKSMEGLYLLRNDLSGFEELSFGNLTSLIELDAGANELGGTIPSEIGQIRTVQSLDLSDNQFVGEIPWKSLANCSSLYNLRLSDNHLSGGILSLLGGFEALQNLYLQNNFLEGVIPSFDRYNLNLQILNVSFNRLNGSLPLDFVQAISSSTQLDFSHNQFTGSLPMWFEKLMMVQFVDFSQNQFAGTIPEGLGKCIELTYLNLSHNNLAGELPVGLANLTHMETLDLSNNSLTGPIPSFLEQFHNLKLLNVSFNSFIGAVPLLGVFKNLTARSFLGNPGLCGPIIKKVCPQANHKHNDQSFHPSWKKITIIALPSSVIGGIVIVLTLYYCHSCYLHSKMAGKNFKRLAEVKRFTAEELSEATQGYSESNLLGEGGLGTVYKGKLWTGKLVAVKRLKDVSLRNALLQEMQVLSRLRHRNLVRILGCVLNLEMNALVLEYMPHGTLEQYLYQNDVGQHECNELMCWEMFMRIAIGVANALVYLHHDYGVPIIHGDVKPSNILLDAHFDAHLSDFGLAKLGQMGTISVSSNFKGSIGYMAPEFAYAARVSTKVDVYSYGVVILEMLTGKKPTQLPELSLHEWVKMKLHKIGGLKNLLHPRLSITNTSLSGMNEHMAVHLLWMGVECTRDRPKDRPTMQQILVSLLNCQSDPALRSSIL